MKEQTLQIAISPSFGKHLERIFSFIIENVDDKNYDNHAYKSKKSCLTAIVSLQKKLIEARLKGREWTKKQKKVMSMISADDICGAFVEYRS